DPFAAFFAADEDASASLSVVDYTAAEAAGSSSRTLSVGDTATHSDATASGALVGDALFVGVVNDFRPVAAPGVAASTAPGDYVLAAAVAAAEPAASFGAALQPAASAAAAAEPMLQILPMAGGG